MNLQRAVTMLSRLPVKHIRTHESVPFVLNPNQRTFVTKLGKQIEDTGLIRAIILKARRVGISSASDGLLFLHCLSKPQTHAKIVAHRADTAEGLFRVPRDLARGLPFPIGEVMARKIIVDHPSGHSILDIATAGAVSGGRGLTLTDLHLSEAANFSGEGSFLSLLPAVSAGKGSMVFIESTANGKTGIGQPFHEFWESACMGKNGYVPIFLPWLDDPECQRDPAEAADAPSTEIERHLMASPFNATRAQIAWFRYTLESQCQGSLPLMMQEYPHTPEVAFRSTGDPAFEDDELAYVRKSSCQPLLIGHFELADGQPTIVASRRGQLHVWNLPVPDHRYYIGADAATGMEDGDFAAFVVLDGTTGKYVARYADRVHPEVLARFLWMAGLHYNKAIINIELTGHLGRTVQQRLRDEYRYYNLYGWKGKDDKLIRAMGTAGVPTPRLGGWETTSNTRRMLFDQFRTNLRSGMKGEPGGIEIFDCEVIAQMDEATLTERRSGWEVEKGHDDILFAYMLANITCVQYPPPLQGIERHRQPDIDGDDPSTRLPFKVNDDVSESLKRHYEKLQSIWERGNRPDPLAGI